MDMQSGRKTHFGRIQRQYLVQRKGFNDPTWVGEEDLNCGAMLQEFDRDGSRSFVSRWSNHTKKLRTNSRPVDLELACKKVAGELMGEMWRVSIQRNYCPIAVDVIEKANEKNLCDNWRRRKRWRSIILSNKETASIGMNYFEKRLNGQEGDRRP